MNPTELLVVAAITIRLLAPLLMLRHPVGGMLAALAADVGDGMLLELTPGFAPEDKHPYDKPLDTYYLAIAYLVALRSWTDVRALAVARVLWYWRLCGLGLYVLTDNRAVFLLCPAAFEFFFLAHEVLRRRSSMPLSTCALAVTTAAAVVLKMPQEYWLHVAHGGTSDLIKRHLFAADPSTTRLEIVAGNLPVLLPAALVGWLLLHRLAAGRPRADDRPGPGHDDRHRRGELTLIPQCRVVEASATTGVALGCVLMTFTALRAPDQQPAAASMAAFLAVTTVLAIVLRDRLPTRILRP